MNAQPFTIDANDIVRLSGVYLWPFVRISAVFLVAPILSAALVPQRVRLFVALTLTGLIAPVLPPPPQVSLFSVAGMVVVAQEFLIGFAMGFTLQMIFDAMVVAGQTTAMSMGLGFATFIDPQRGVSVPVLSQYYLILATLLFLSLNGHLVAIEVLTESFTKLPIGAPPDVHGFRAVAEWGTVIFAGGLRIALPAVTAILLVNLAFGVMSRAAPTLNLFAVGFPVSMMLGFIIILIGLPALYPAIVDLFERGFATAHTVLSHG